MSCRSITRQPLPVLWVRPTSASAGILIPDRAGFGTAGWPGCTSLATREQGRCCRNHRAKRRICAVKDQFEREEKVSALAFCVSHEQVLGAARILLDFEAFLVHLFVLACGIENHTDAAQNTPCRYAFLLTARTHTCWRLCWPSVPCSSLPMLNP